MKGYPWLAVTPISQTAGSLLAPTLAASWLHGQLGSMSVCLADCRRACCILEYCNVPAWKTFLSFQNINTKGFFSSRKKKKKILDILHLFFQTWLHGKWSKHFHSAFWPALQDPLWRCLELSYILSLITLYWHWLHKWEKGLCWYRLCSSSLLLLEH